MQQDFNEKIKDFGKRIAHAKEYLDLAGKQKELQECENKMTQAGFWDKEGSQEVVVNVKRLKSLLEPWCALDQDFLNVKEISHLLEEESDDDLSKELGDEIEKIEKNLADQEMKALLGQKEDFYNTFLAINAGAGGTESCDWVAMLYRMYTRWIEDKGFFCKVVDLQSGDEAGIKNLVILIQGEYAYGLLKSEIGVHRLVRISPFDSNKRRHTSFASVDVFPEIEDDIEIEINESDLKIDTYRSSGSGGQHVNVTDSAVRITHLPSGIVVQCQNERSQHKNKAQAMKVLKSRLYEKQRQEREKELTNSYEKKGDIAWGNQIRSYVMHPYSMVKDHRTKHQIGNVNAVMDGGIDEFIEQYLKWVLGKNI